MGDVVKTSRLASLGTKNSSVNQEDWELILKFILLGTAAGPEHDGLTKDVEAVARVRDTSLEITLQRNVQGITVCAIFILPIFDADDLLATTRYNFSCRR